MQNRLWFSVLLFLFVAGGVFADEIEIGLNYSRVTVFYEQVGESTSEPTFVIDTIKSTLPFDREIEEAGSFPVLFDYVIYGFLKEKAAQIIANNPENDEITVMFKRKACWSVRQMPNEFVIAPCKKTEAMLTKVVIARDNNGMYSLKLSNYYAEMYEPSCSSESEDCMSIYHTPD